MNAPEKLLIVGPSWVGDMVIAQSLFRSLVEAAPGTTIAVVAPSWSTPLLARMPEVHAGYELAVARGRFGFAARRELGRRLAANGYDRAIVLPRSLKSALVPWFARVPLRTGFRGEHRYGLINDMRPFDPAVLDQTVKRFLALGPRSPAQPIAGVPRPRLVVDAERQAQLLTALKLGDGGPAVALLPGAEYGPAKRWPAERYAALAARLVRNGHSVWLFGSPAERALGRRIVELAGRPGVHDLCGRTTLVDVVDLLGAVPVAVSNDSGLMHVAAACGAHVVALYGSSSPEFTPPLTDSRSIHALRLACSPCFERSCPLGHLACLRDISVDSVAASVAAAFAALPTMVPATARAASHG